MAQFLTLLPILLLFAVFSPIVCPSNKMFNERRQRAPYIESIENISQHLRETVASRLRKGTTHNKERAESHPANPPKNNQQENKESIVDKNIRSVFTTNFGAGLYLFNNTAPYVNQTHFNSYNDQMVGDQPVPYTPPSTSSNSDKEFFKVQRSPEGNLSIIYNEDYIGKAEKDKPNSGSNKKKSEGRFQTHFSDGLPLKKDNFAASLPAAANAHSKNTAIHFPTEEPDKIQRSNELDIDDCLEEDEVKNKKSFCSHLRNYPEKNHLEELIKDKFPNLESFFGEDLVLPQNISQRMNNAPNEEYLCRSRVRVIYPQSGQNKDWDWIYIVNSPHYKQGIRIEECIEPFKTCGENTGLSLPNRFTATCEQSYIYRSLIAYNNDTIFKDTFRIPSCCKCVLRSN